MIGDGVNAFFPPFLFIWLFFSCFGSGRVGGRTTEIPGMNLAMITHVHVLLRNGMGMRMGLGMENKSRALVRKERDGWAGVRLRNSSCLYLAHETVSLLLCISHHGCSALYNFGTKDGIALGRAKWRAFLT